MTLWQVIHLVQRASARGGEPGAHLLSPHHLGLPRPAILEDAFEVVEWRL